MGDTSFLLFRKAPFLKLLPALMAGIIVQWNFPFPVTVLIIIFIIGMSGLLLFRGLLIKSRYFFRIAGGLTIAAIFFGLGALFVYQKDI